MGVFGADTYREPSLIPPDSPEPDDPITEESEHLIRRMYKDGHIEWERKQHDLAGYDQDCLEEAYEMALAAMDRQMKRVREAAYGRGAYQTAYAMANKGVR